jgi:hypothetical protein
MRGQCSTLYQPNSYPKASQIAFRLAKVHQSHFRHFDLYKSSTLATFPVRCHFSPTKDSVVITALIALMKHNHTLTRRVDKGRADRDRHLHLQ